MVVATDCKAFDEVIRSYNRLLDLKGKWSDPEVLGILVKSIVTNDKDMSDFPCRERYFKDSLKLFGRITSVVRSTVLCLRTPDSAYVAWTMGSKTITILYN